MVINKDKTKVISFSKSRKWAFPPELHFSDGTPIEYISDTRLVGVVVSQDLRWFKNTSYICQKARNKLWMLRRMMNLNLTIYEMFDVYSKEIRSLLEMAVPVWNSGLTNQQIYDIESIQKVAMQIILQNKYVNYQSACQLFSAQTLADRRTRLCSKFASKNLKGENSFFELVGTNVETRQKSDLVKEYKCNFGRFYNSSLPYLARLINSNNRLK